jgi:hypothetical protein
MCQASPMMPETRFPAVRQSVHECGILEALRYKWIESEKAGHDLGDGAIRTWVRRYWNGFLRARWLEHLEGRTFWVELDKDDYGLLRQGFLDSPLLGEVLDRLKRGEENLDLINWALDDGHDLVELVEILEVLDINSRRIECQFIVRLSRSA